MKKVLFIIGDLIGGGAERVVTLLANEFANRGIEVAILAFPNNENSYYLDEKVTVFREKKYNNGFKNLFFRANIINKRIQEYNPDITISFTTQKNVCLILGSLFNKWKIVVSERNDPNQDPKSRILRFLRRVLYRFADGYVFQTEEARLFFSDKIAGKGCVIANPIDLNNLPNYDGVREKRIVTVGRLETEKNQIMAIKAFEKVCDDEYVLEIYGEGSKRKELEEYIQNNKLYNVRLMGFCDDVIDRIKNASAFLFPSNYEGMPNALIEAMAIGLPVISTDHPIGGARVLLQDGVDGFLVPVGDYNAMAEKLDLVLSNAEMAEMIGCNARTFVKENLNIPVIAEKWIQYLNHLIDDKL